MNDTNKHSPLPTTARAASWMREQQRWAEDEGFPSRAAYCRVAADALEAHARLLAERDEAVAALVALVGELNKGQQAANFKNARALLARIGVL